MAAAFFALDKLKVAVITGQHAYDVPSFNTLFRQMPDVDAYVQTLDDWTMDVGKVRQVYDAVVFYNMHRPTPGSEGGRYPKGTREALEQLGESAQGIVVLHHALLAFPDWLLWSEVVGIADRRFGYHMNQSVHVEVVDAEHPITRGLGPWEMVDETYTMQDVGEGSHILLATAHPLSMKTLGWTRQYRQARVFCFESGHDNSAYSDASFNTVLARGIQWVAGWLDRTKSV